MSVSSAARSWRLPLLLTVVVIAFAYVGGLFERRSPLEPLAIRAPDGDVAASTSPAGLSVPSQRSSTEPGATARPAHPGLQIDDRAPSAVSDPLKGVDLAGRLHRPGQSIGCQAVVLVFLGIHCPISNNALPGLNHLHREGKPHGIELFGILSAPSVSRTEALRHAADYAIEFPVLMDSTGELSERFGATHTPHAFVTTPQGQLLYAGAIDDQFPSVGKKRLAAGRLYLREALDDRLAGRAVRTPQTHPVGCLLESRHHSRKSSLITFAREVAPVIYSNCTTCHRQGAVAPFPLESFEEVVRHAAQIKVMVELRLMPPWKPERGFGHFRDELVLTEREVELLISWIDAGQPRGDMEQEPAAPKFEGGWQLGTPDLIAEVPEAFSVPADGPDIYQYFVVPSGLVEDRLVSAIEYRPGQPQVVHHASFRFDDAGLAKRLDDAFPGPGYARTGNWGFDSGGTLGGWAVGITPQRLPSGYGRPIKAGSDVVLQTHYHPAGRSVEDRGRLGLYFAERGATQRIEELFVANMSLSIPPGEREFVHRADYVLSADATLHAILPHAHLLARQMEAVAILPDGRVEPLIRILDWDFGWQSQYSFAQPLRLPAGTRIEFVVTFDNSVFNPLNPFNPARRVRWGEESTAEMAVCFLDVSADSDAQLDTLLAHNRRYIAEQSVPSAGSP